MEHLIDIPGRLNSVAVEKHIAGTDQIYDDLLETTLDILNLENITDVKVQGGKLQFLNIKGLVLKEISIASETQKQSDWNLTDSTQVDFIKNKPTVYNKLEVDNKLTTKQDTINDLTTIRSGAQEGATAYQKPSTGIPATDLASAVLVSLGKADTALQEHQSLAGLVNTGSYNTVSKKIELKHDNNVLAEIDATAFIKDGMVSSVTINNGYLVITFNTDAGKEPISIALTDIFNPANYYDKDDVDGLLAGKVDKIEGKGLSTNDYTDSDKNKLAGIAAGAEVNVQSDWSETDTTSDAYIANKPTVPDAQIQSDWNQSDNTKKDFIKNKPTIPTVPTNVSAFTNDAGYLTQHQDLTNYVQKSQTVGLLKNDGTVDTNTYLTQHQDISGKADKSEMSVVPGTGTDADKTTITLKQGTSATVLTTHQDISGKEDITPIEAVASGTTAITAQVNKYYEVAGTVSSLTVTLPTPTANTEVTMVVVHFTAAANNPVVFVTSSATVAYSAAYAVVANKEYELSCLYNGSKWIVSSMEVAV